MRTISLLSATLLAAFSITAQAAPETYTIDPTHTFPSFEAPHTQGISIWRGKFDKTSGKVVLDREKQTGAVDITIDAASIDFGYEPMNEHARAADMFDVAKYPTITYKADAIEFKNGVPAKVNGLLTMHGVTKPVPVTFNSFKCIKNTRNNTDVCGADLSAELNRADFGITLAVDSVGSPMVRLQIQVEAVKDAPPAK